MRIIPIAIATIAALHLIYLVLIANGFESPMAVRQQSAAVQASARELGLLGVSLYVVIDILVILACIKSLRRRK